MPRDTLNIILIYKLLQSAIPSIYYSALKCYVNTYLSFINFCYFVGCIQSDLDFTWQILIGDRTVIPRERLIAEMTPKFE